MVRLTLTPPPHEAAHWTVRAMAKAAGMAVATVQDIWKAHGLAPHRWRSFKLSNDPLIQRGESSRDRVAFRKRTLLPLDDCLYTLQATIPRLTRSALHRCFQRHGISRLPEIEGDKPAKKPFKRYPLGYFHIDIAEVRTEEGKLYLIVAVDRTSKYAFAHLQGLSGRATALQARPHPLDLGTEHLALAPL